MAKKDTQELELQAQSDSLTAAEPITQDDSAGVYLYIGPSMMGLVGHSEMVRGSRETALAHWAAAIEAVPLCKTLIVSAEHMPSARLEVKREGTALYKNYQRAKEQYRDYIRAHGNVHIG